MKKWMCVVTLSAALAAVAEDDSLAEYGGEVTKWPKDPGLFLFVNTQERVAAKTIDAPVKTLTDEFSIDIRTRKENAAPFDIRKVPALLRGYGAKGAIWIVDDAMLPVTLAAPESGWGILNVSPLLADTPDAKKLEMRVMKFVHRLFADIHGIGDPITMPGCVTKAAVGVKGVDALTCSTYSPDADTKVLNFLVMCGYKQKLFGTYQDACEGGWAPAPTNDVQKAIWEKVHALPTAPIKILPPNKKGK